MQGFVNYKKKDQLQLSVLVISEQKVLWNKESKNVSLRNLRHLLFLYWFKIGFLLLFTGDLKCKQLAFWSWCLFYLYYFIILLFYYCSVCIILLHYYSICIILLYYYIILFILLYYSIILLFYLYYNIIIVLYYYSICIIILLYYSIIILIVLFNWLEMAVCWNLLECCLD